MMDTNLIKLIEDSITQHTIETDAAKAKADAEEVEYQNELEKATGKALAGIDKRDSVPSALLPYCKPMNLPSHWDAAGGARSLREGWLPFEFRISAPGLARIEFSIKAEWDMTAGKNKPARVYSLVARHGVANWDAWHEAIAEAARLYLEQQEWKRQEERRKAEEKATRLAAPPPTTAERFESLIRDIVREEITEARNEDV